MNNHWVKTWRESEGWTVADLAQRAKIPVAAVESIEQGEPLDRAVAAKIRDAVNGARRERAASVILRLSRLLRRPTIRVIRGLPRSQRAIERVLGLSQGYLSRLAAGAGNPSPALIAVLTLLANDPRRFAELDPRPTPQPTTGDTDPSRDTRQSVTRRPSPRPSLPR